MENHDTGSTQQHWCGGAPGGRGPGPGFHVCTPGRLPGGGCGRRAPGAAAATPCGCRHAVSTPCTRGRPTLLPVSSLAPGARTQTIALRNHTPDHSCRPFPGDFVGVGYAYILTHPGVPCVFYEHLFDWGEELGATIKRLIEVGADAWCQGRCGEAVECGRAARAPGGVREPVGRPLVWVVVVVWGWRGVEGGAACRARRCPA